MIGFFALLYGYFYVAMLQLLRPRRACRWARWAAAPQSMNINQQLIRPLLQNVTILLLFVMPMITMRTYAEEKRSGTIELLLTSPLTDFQIILGKFLGALALYARDARGHARPHRRPVRLRHPEWKPIATAYLGLLLLGGCFISLGLFISSLTKNQIVAGMVTFAVFLLLWVISWIGSFVRRPMVDDVTSYLSIIDHFDDFAKGVIDTTHLDLLPELHHVRPVPDRQVGRQRTVARANGMNRISQHHRLARHGAGLRGASRSASACRPGSSTPYYLAWAGLVCMLALHGRPVARDRRLFSRPPGALRHPGRRSSVLVVLGILVAVNYIGTRQNKRWDLTASQAVQPVGSEPQRPREARRAAARSWSSRRSPSSDATAIG